jgi:hypothetical protein
MVCELFKQINLTFTDPQKKAKAVFKINKIKQKSQPFKEFLQEFKQTLFKAKG